MCKKNDGKRQDFFVNRARFYYFCGKCGWNAYASRKYATKGEIALPELDSGTKDKVTTKNSGLIDGETKSAPSKGQVHLKYILNKTTFYLSERQV